MIAILGHSTPAGELGAVVVSYSVDMRGGRSLSVLDRIGPFLELADGDPFRIRDCGRDEIFLKLSRRTNLFSVEWSTDDLFEFGADDPALESATICKSADPFGLVFAGLTFGGDTSSELCDLIFRRRRRLRPRSGAASSEDELVSEKSVSLLSGNNFRLIFERSRELLPSFICRVSFNLSLRRLWCRVLCLCFADLKVGNSGSADGGCDVGSSGSETGGDGCCKRAGM